MCRIWKRAGKRRTGAAREGYGSGVPRTLAVMAHDYSIWWLDSRKAAAHAKTPMVLNLPVNSLFLGRDAALGASLSSESSLALVQQQQHHYHHYYYPQRAISCISNASRCMLSLYSKTRHEATFEAWLDTPRLTEATAVDDLGVGVDQIPGTFRLRGIHPNWRKPKIASEPGSSDGAILITLRRREKEVRLILEIDYRIRSACIQDSQSAAPPQAVIRAIFFMPCRQGKASSRAIQHSQISKIRKIIERGAGILGKRGENAA
ncbi:hypothetical protein EJ03DRAFT_338688 [Teratosphaeria nubilosa]|uniref:Uncharacterized protein n=1 Tax=Teratosphaeria nubilosa TaxID=161662 RepID=A0A6G1KZA5_9PEZI|nr:hypothetical protein EJ03DRAFT_338688 [Teratosphaeria nubilosa]